MRFSAVNIIALIPVCISCAPLVYADVIPITAPSTSWSVVGYPGNADAFDGSNDQQTGNARSDADIVGNSTTPAFYNHFNPGTPGSSTDGDLMFRVRLGTPGGSGANPAFANNLFVGIDADSNGSLDLYVAVNNQGGNDQLAIYGTGTGANTSPNTMSISGPNVTYTETATNFHYAPVDTPALDLDADGNTDYHLSFAIPFADIVSQMALVSGINVTDTTPLSFVLATSTQTNSFNQDISGIGRNYNGATSWTGLGVLSTPQPLNSGGAAVPEPSSFALLALSLPAGWYARRRKRKAEETADDTETDEIPEA